MCGWMCTIDADDRRPIVGEKKACKGTYMESLPLRACWRDQVVFDEPGASPANSSTRMPASGGEAVMLYTQLREL